MRIISHAAVDRRSVLFAAMMVLVSFGAGCAAPGSPLLRVSSTDVEGPIIANCKNVSSRYRVNEYITASYLSTWGSAFLEGAVQGAREGFDQATGDMNIVRRSAWRAAQSRVAGQLSQGEDALLFTPSSFCRAYSAQFGDVARAVSEILPLLGNPVRINDPEAGYFETDFVDRGHQAAQWRDRYIIGLTSDAPERTVVRVVRILLIARGGGPYNQAVSVGHNEAWLMTRVADKLK